MKEYKIVVCRHAESLEDVDNDIYDQLNDLDIPLTEKGISQSLMLGKELSAMFIESAHVSFFTSPGIRNQQTLAHILPLLPGHLKHSVEIEPLITKQDWGEINSVNRPMIERDRYQTGVLRYNFPSGESAQSMIGRLRCFKEKVYRLQDDTRCDVVVLSHGFEFRVLLMIVMGWDEEYFESLGNLNNCEYRVLTRITSGKYSLDKPLRKHGLPITRLMMKKG